MEIKINYETNKGFKQVSYYPTFFRNPDLRNELVNHFFKEDFREHNLTLIRNRFFDFVKENDMNLENAENFAREHLSENSNLMNTISLSFIPCDKPKTLQFMMNVFYNMTKVYFNSDAIDLALFLSLNGDPEMAFIVPENETKEWIDILKRYEFIKLCPPIGYRAKSNPLNRLFDDYSAGLIKGNLIIRNEYFEYDYDEDEQEMLKEDYQTTEFEALMMDIVSFKKGNAYVSINEIKELHVYEEELIHLLKV